MSRHLRAHTHSKDVLGGCAFNCFGGVTSGDMYNRGYIYICAMHIFYPLVEFTITVATWSQNCRSFVMIQSLALW